MTTQIKRKCSKSEDGDVCYYEAEVFGDPPLSSGGWSDKWMSNDELQAAHDRAIALAYGSAPKDNDDWIPNQCGGCRFYGAINSDWGICCNPASPHDLKVLFEHGGCDKHSEIKEDAS